jgi:1-acylglycerone phosphate reductase
MREVSFATNAAIWPISDLSGVHVVASARRVEVLSEMAALGMSTLELDVTDENSIKRGVADVSRITDGKLDFLVNNA